jgi:hypothetical protein
MGILGRIFGGKTKQVEGLDVPCPHTALAPRWEKPEDMGKVDRVSTYVCTACNGVFTPEEAKSFSLNL